MRLKELLTNMTLITFILLVAWVSGNSLTTYQKQLEQALQVPNVVYVTTPLGSGTGTLLTSNTVLTAKHVVVGVPSTLMHVVLPFDDTLIKVRDVIYSEIHDACILVLEQSVNVVPVKYNMKWPKRGDNITRHSVPASGRYGVLYRESVVAGFYLTPCDVHVSHRMVLFDGAPIGGESGAGVFNEDNELIGVVVIRSNDGLGGFLALASIRELL